MGNRYFHLHLVSDATGDTLRAVGRAASAQYAQSEAVEHVHSMVRSEPQLARVLERIEAEPGIVLYTLVNGAHAQRLETACQQLHVPVYNVLGPVFNLFKTFLGTGETGQIGAQHHVDASYYHRIEAMSFTLTHDDGLSPHSLGEADIILLGISRTSKTPTSVYLALRGLRVANIPVVAGLPLPSSLFEVQKPMVIGLVASPRHILAVRQNRLLAPEDHRGDQTGLGETNDYLNRSIISEEIAFTRQVCQRQQWPILDVSRKSIEETAAAILKAHQRHRRDRLEKLQAR